ncbi:MAG: hypothetical protein DI626_02645 [Micavibrio aeruginosavorus]|uniref:Uncharacterized protein n=1 Tax=Micavibrio aeruginosavorus TaxID=349221 RepID=A0A2W5A3B7_9BACT|nr:MAG: hypothetical protein DI626_02645 [Micavibrio aeruginosavorus]
MGAVTGAEAVAAGACGAGSAGCVATKGLGVLISGEETVFGTAMTLSFGPDGTPTALTVSPDDVETPDTDVAVAGNARQSTNAKEHSPRKDDVV